MSTSLIEECLELTGSELDDVIAEAEAARNRADARIAAASAVVSARQSFRDDGHRSMRSYLKTTLNCSGTRANRIRKHAAMINDHPDIGATWADGHIGTEQVDTLAGAHSHTRAGHRFPEFQPQLLDHAEHLPLDDFGVVIKRFVTQADPDGAFDDQRFQEDESSASVTVTNGAVEVHAHGGSPKQAEEMSAVFELAEQVEFERDCDARRAEFGDDALAHPLPRTARQRKFAAMHQIFMSWATVPADAKTPEPLVNFVIDHVTAGNVLADHGLVADPDLFGVGAEAFADAERNLLARHCHTTTGTPVHPDVALKATIEGRVRRVVVDADGVVIDMGRTSRLFTGHARSAAQMLASTCTHPGCEIPVRFCDVDHRREWVAEEGPTDQANAMPLCGPHDRWKHACRIRTRRAANHRIYLIRPDGTTVKPAGEREPDWIEPAPFDAPAPESEPDVVPASLAEPIFGADALADLGQTIPWGDFVVRQTRRPELDALAEAGWTIIQLEIPST